MRFLWAFLGLACVGLALVGVVLPLLPTVPFLLLAAFFFARSSERLHYWLLSHSTFGPLIDDWHSRGAIRPRAKRIATLSIILVVAVSIILGLNLAVLVFQGVVLSCVLAFIWTRPTS